ncbi:MAG: hypothetical protein V3R84_02530, partial [Acidimicrobiia bacterium]
LLENWSGSVIDGVEGAAARAATAADWQEFEASAEFDAYEAALLGGLTTCVAAQEALDAAASRGAFGLSAWMENDAREVVEGFLGCDTIPSDLPAALGH